MNEKEDISSKKEVQREKLVDAYLKEVEMHLKGFSREAKDSILIEIREHIQEKIGEFEKNVELNIDGEEEEEDTNGFEGKKEIKQFIEAEFGNPQMVAESFSPNIYVPSTQRNAYRVFSVIIALFFLLAWVIPMLGDHLRDLEEFIGYIFLSILGIVMAYFSIYFGLTFSGNRMRAAWQMNAAFLSNTVLTVIFIWSWALIINSSLNIVVVPGFEDWYHYNAFGEHPFLIFVLLTIVGFSWYSNYKGYLLFTRDTADGIAPLANISYHVLPFTAAITFITIIIVANEMFWTTDIIFRWNSDESYTVLTILSALSSASFGMLVLRRMRPLQTYRIERETFVISLIILVGSMIVVSSFLAGYVDMSDEYSYDRWYEHTDSKGIYPLTETLFQNNGSLYSWNYQRNESGNHFNLIRWNKNESVFEHHSNTKIGLGLRDDQRLGPREIRASGKYLHGHFRISTFEKKGRTITTLSDDGRLYFLMTMEGELIAEQWFEQVSGLEKPERSLMVNGSSALLLYYEPIWNLTNESESYAGYLTEIRIKAYEFENGDLRLENTTLAVFPMTRYFENTRAVRLWETEVFQKSSMFTIILYLSHYQPGIWPQVMIHEVYQTEMSWAEEILGPLTLIANGTENNGKASRKLINNVTSVISINGQYFFLREWRYGLEDYWKYSMVHIDLNGTGSETTFLQKEHLAFAPFIDPIITDDEGITHFAYIDYNETNDSLSYFLKYHRINSKGEVVQTKIIPLNSNPIFAFLEEYSEPRNYQSTRGVIFQYPIVFDGTTLHSGIHLMIMEPDEKPHLGLNLMLILHTDGTNITFTQIGPDIPEKEDNSRIIRSMLIGALTGQFVTVIELWILKKRIPKA